MAESLQPQLAEAKAMVEATEGRARQAGAFPNPEAIVGAQQIPFSGNAPNEKEYVAGVGQAVPLSRRLSKAREAELLDREVRARGLEVKRRDIRKRVHSAFATALANSGTLKTEILSRAETVLNGAEARYAAGDISLAEILPVRRDWAAVQLSYLESLRDVMQAWGEVRSFGIAR